MGRERMAVTSNGPRTLGKRSPSVKNMERTLLKEKAYEELKSLILNGRFPAGSFLAERKLASDMGMSKTPVKAALERLQHEGLVSISPQQGIVVRELSLSELIDQYEIRVALESYVASTLTGRLTTEQIKRLEANLAEQASMYQKNLVPLCVKLDAEFHLLLAESLGNREILRVMTELSDKVRRVITRVYELHRQRAHASYLEHFAIFSEIRDGKSNRAAELVRQHLDQGRQLLLSFRE